MEWARSYESGGARAFAAVAGSRQKIKRVDEAHLKFTVQVNGSSGFEFIVFKV